MLKLMISMLYLSLLLPAYLAWGRRQAEGQIDKMQAAAFDSPGVEAPVPLQVILTGAGLFGGHFVLARLLGLRGWQAWLSLLIGSGAGIIVYLLRQPQGGSQTP
jgi:hypothetical protein